VYLYGFGFSAVKLLKVKEAENVLEKYLMRLGIGLGILTVLSVLLSVIMVPLDWRIFLALALIIPIYYLFIFLKSNFITTDSSSLPSKIEWKWPFKLTKQNILIIVVLLLFILNFYMYSTGAFVYEYLEDDDPWEHAKAAEYVALDKTAVDLGSQEGFNKYGYFFYMDPYPPSYDIVMGLLHQTNDDLSWTLKYFNALIISLGVLFFYFFVKQFTGKSTLALWSTIFLTAIPSYMSHFIWAISLSVTLFMPALYCLFKMEEHLALDGEGKWSFVKNKWGYLFAILSAAIYLAQPSTGMIFILMLVVIWAVKAIYSHNLQKHLIYFILIGGIISLFWWVNHIGGLSEGLANATVNESISGWERLKEMLAHQFRSASGSATRPYTFNDFFIAKTSNMINNPIGWGIGVTLLTIIGLILFAVNYKKLKITHENKENWWIITTLILFFIFFMIVNSATFGTPGFYSFRTWMFLALITAIICAQATLSLSGLLKNKLLKYLLLFAILILILFTSFIQKYTVDTALWGPGGSFQSYEEADGYAWMKNNLPNNTPVFPLCPETPRNKDLPGFEDAKILGFNMYSCGWCSDIINYRETAINQSAADLHDWLKQHNYQYFTLDLICVSNYGADAINQKLQEYDLSGLFKLSHRNNAFFLFSVN
jgi:hypothetical protein